MKRNLLPAFVLMATLSLPLAISAYAQDKVLTQLDGFRARELAVGGFELATRQRVSIEAVGFRDRSRRHDAMLSSAWIIDANTREMVWALEDADSDRRSRHLREYRDEPELNAGRYEVYYSTFPAWGGDWDQGAWWHFTDSFSFGDFDWDDYKDAAGDFEIVVRGRGKSFSEDEVTDFHDNLKKGAIINFTGLRGGRYEKIGLEVDREVELEIYAIGELDKDEIYDGAWIINTANREKVWALDYWDSDPAGGASKNRVFKDTIKLPAGKYALYCASDNSHHVGDWNSTPPYDPFFWGVTIQVADAAMKNQIRTYEYEDMPDKNVVVSLTRLRDGDFKSQGFTLKKDMSVRIYAIGEGSGREMYDSSRIVDADSRKIVWEMKARKTEHAGGASKNRVFDDVIDLPAGNYIAYAYTDGSHSYSDWNSSAPHDQEHWGLTIMVGNGDLKNVAEYNEANDANTLVRLVGMGNNERERQRFRLDRETRVSVYAIGEGTGGRMYDYAWIEDDRGKVVWEMTYRKTDHAGGAKKNREYSGELKLDTGEYTVYFESDGSHSFNRWNARPPDDFLNWGVTLKKVDGKR